MESCLVVLALMATIEQEGRKKMMNIPNLESANKWRPPS